MPLGHYTDHGPMGLGQYNSLGEGYCGPHTASEVFLIILLILHTVKYLCWQYIIGMASLPCSAMTEHNIYKYVKNRHECTKVR